MFEEKKIMPDMNQDIVQEQKKPEYSWHSLSQVLWGVEKNSRQLEFKFKIRPMKPEVITGSEGMVKMHFKNVERAKEGEGLG